MSEFLSPPPNNPEEPDLIAEFLDFMADRKETFSSRYAAHFGHLDEPLQLQIMQVVRLGMIHDDANGLKKVLSDGMVIVPGDNDISTEQIDILTGAYAFNREHWEEKLNTWLKQ
ncbi:MAG: hypothetical protein KBD46_04075 [Candidatus Levybacteria bacterium]|nr:hypothetical protein [Candidatus Levybacteria bacterium]